MKEYRLKIKHTKAYYYHYRFIQFTIRIFFKIIYRIEEKNRELIPKKGGFILCSNHISYLDPVIIGIYFPRYIFFMAKIEIFKSRLLTVLVKFYNAFPVNRNSFDRKTIRDSINIIKSGEVLGVFPQGTRYPDGYIGEGKKGIGMISTMAGCPIVPMAISGTNKIIKKPHKRIFFPKVKINYGKAIDTKAIKDKYNSKQAIKIIVDKTMNSIRELYKEIK